MGYLNPFPAEPVMNKKKPAKPAPKQPEMQLAPDDAAAEIAAEEAREKIVTEDANRIWNGATLHPWSEERARLLEALCAADVPLPDVESCSDVTFFHGMFPRAVKVLYLMHHDPEDWRPLRSRLLTVIDQWGIQMVPGSTIAEKRDAVHFMIRIETAHRDLMAVRRSNGGRSGN